MHKPEERCQPWLDCDEPTSSTQHASRFGKNLIEVHRQMCEMVKTALHNQKVLAGIGER